jgi:hypothetical protein
VSALTKAQEAEARMLKAQGETNERIAAYYGIDVDELPLKGFVEVREPDSSKSPGTPPATPVPPAAPAP